MGERILAVLKRYDGQLESVIQGGNIKRSIYKCRYVDRRYRKYRGSMDKEVTGRGSSTC
jgi:hypothetical protein